MSGGLIKVLGYTQKDKIIQIQLNITTFHSDKEHKSATTKKPSPKPGDKLQMGFKSIIRAIRGA